MAKKYNEEKQNWEEYKSDKLCCDSCQTEEELGYPPEFGYCCCIHAKEDHLKS